MGVDTHAQGSEDNEDDEDDEDAMNKRDQVLGFVCAASLLGCQSPNSSQVEAQNRQSQRLVVPQSADAEAETQVPNESAPAAAVISRLPMDAGAPLLREAGPNPDFAPVEADLAPCRELDDRGDWCRGLRMFSCPQYGPADHVPRAMGCRPSGIALDSKRARGIICCSVLEAGVE